MAASQTIETYQTAVMQQSANSEKGVSSNASEKDNFKNIFDNITNKYDSKKDSNTNSKADNTNNAAESTKVATNNQVNTDNKNKTDKTESKSTALENKETTQTDLKTDNTVKNEATAIKTDTSNTNASENIQSREVNLTATEQPQAQTVFSTVENITAPAQDTLPGIQTPAQIAQENINTDINKTTNIDTNVEYIEEKPQEMNIKPDTQSTQTEKFTQISQDTNELQSQEQVEQNIDIDNKKTDAPTKNSDATIQEPTFESIASEVVQSIAVPQNENVSTTASEDTTDGQLYNDTTPKSPITISQETMDWVSKTKTNQNTEPQQTPTTLNETTIKPASIDSNNAQTAITNDIGLLNQIPQDIPVNLAQQSVSAQEQPQIFIQAATDLVESNNISGQDVSQNTNIKTKLQTTQSPLTQDVLDDLDAKITSVKTSTTSNQNQSGDTNLNQNTNKSSMLTQQNTQEQTIKLEIQNNSQTVNESLQQATTAAMDKTQTGVQINISGTEQIQTTQTSPKELTSSNILEQINKQMDLKELQNSQTNVTTKVNIVLKPENLGKIEIELTNTKEGLIAKMTTENEQVKNFLDKNINGLKETLGSHGVNINNVSIKVTETQSQNTEFSFDKQNQQEGTKQNFQNAKEGNNNEQEIKETNKTESQEALAEENEETGLQNEYRTYNQRGRIL